MVDIEINARSSLFLNLETNLILYLYPRKVYKIQPIRVAYQIQKPGNLKFCAPFKINIQKLEGLSDFENLIFLYIPGKSGSSKKLKVSTLNIRIKQSGLKLSHSKVPSSVSFFVRRNIFIFFNGYHSQKWCLMNWSTNLDNKKQPLSHTIWFKLFALKVSAVDILLRRRRRQKFWSFLFLK